MELHVSTADRNFIKFFFTILKVYFSVTSSSLPINLADSRWTYMCRFLVLVPKIIAPGAHLPHNYLKKQ